MKSVWTSLRFFLLLSVLTGVVYPALTFFLGQIFFRDKAAGQLIVKDGVVIGSRLLAQKFTSEKYFWSRPSSIDFNPLPSGGSNLGPTSEALKKTVVEREMALKKAHPTSSDGLIPQDLLFASGSGLDPEITVAAAEFQTDRVAKSRGLDPVIVRKVISSLVAGPDFGFLGEPRVNVLELNLALDFEKP